MKFNLFLRDKNSKMSYTWHFNIHGLNTDMCITSLLRDIKNAVIGNRARKSTFIELGVVPKLVHLLTQENASVDFIVEAVVLLASLAKGNKKDL